MLYLQNNNPNFPHYGSSNDMRKKIENYSFKLSDKIGKGYSSNVYKGQNDLTKQIVAIKVIDLKMIKDHITKHLLDSEIICIRKLSHTNLLKYYDSYATSNNCYIITEFCDGGDMAKQLKKKKRLNQTQIMQFFGEFYEGYKSLLDSGFIHRDIKPANVFIKDKTIKIADFGFVKSTSSSSQQNYNLGTPLYMSPQTMKSNIYTQKTDIWSIGIMLYELVHGKTPWLGRNDKQIRFQIDRAHIHYDDRLMSQQLRKFIQSCLAKNTKDRISIKEMYDHQWMQKIRQMKDKDVLKDKCLLNNKNYLSIQLQKEKSLSKRTTMDCEQHERIKKCGKSVENKMKVVEDDHQNKKKKKHYKNTIDYLAAMMNYLRYIYKVRQQLIKVQLKQTKQLQNSLANELMSYMAMHKLMVENSQNTLKVPDWQKFTQSSKWSIYKTVIEQYQDKYGRIQLDKDWKKSCLPISILCKQAIIKLKQQVSCFQEQKRYKVLEIIDYLITIYQLSILLNEEGLIKFTQHSKVGQIVQTKCQVMQRNYNEVSRQISKKLMKLNFPIN